MINKKNLSILRTLLLLMVLVTSSFLLGRNISTFGVNQTGSVFSFKTFANLLGKESRAESCALSGEQSAGLTQYNQVGAGSVDNPWEIYTAAQLSSMANTGYHYNKYFIQCADIDLTSTPQFATTYFMGSYNGNYKFIGGYHYQGQPVGGSSEVALFGNFSYGTIEHVRMRQVDIAVVGSSNYLASAASLVTSVGNGAKLDDIEIYNANISADIAAAVFISSSNGTVTNVIAEEVNVQGKSSAAGLAHFVIPPSTVKNIKVNGSVSNTGGDGFTAGMVNIVGYQSSSTVQNIVYQNLDFEGSLIGHDVAGITNSLNGVNLKNAQVEGQILSTADQDNSAGVGGVVGQSGSSTIEKVYFKGLISRKTLNFNYCGLTNFVGGIVGSLGNSQLSWSYAKSRFEIEHNCGGIGGGVGYLSNSSIQNSYADTHAVLSGTNGYLGGLVGWLYNERNIAPFKNNYSKLAVVKITGATLFHLGGHFGVVIAPKIPSEWSFASGDPFPVIANTAGPFVGAFTQTPVLGGSQTSVSPFYYDSAMTCAGTLPSSCNNIGSPTPLSSLLNPSFNPLKKWTFDANSWVESVNDTFPGIPTAGY